ncbi:hypothetical protein [Phenylobacterium deserti]|uniref:hypothetical protein n=1 Tax=Phenylobacterium deserti TaxID=1914756 RepID=UPI0014032472|nr:hypothetical protein [Phenylobacterium deserti]
MTHAALARAAPARSHRAALPTRRRFDPVYDLGLGLAVTVILVIPGALSILQLLQG